MSCGHQLFITRNNDKCWEGQGGRLTLGAVVQAKPLSRSSAPARQQPQAVNVATNLRSNVKTLGGSTSLDQAERLSERHRSALARPNT